MAGMGPAPKPDADRRRTNASTFQWKMLPAAGRAGEPPALPPLREWDARTLAEWSYWWSTPQATAWDQSGRSLARWALMFDRLLTDDNPPTTLHAQLLAIEDRHGFTPAAMLKLRWLIDESPATPAKQPARPDAAPGSGLAQLIALRGGAGPAPKNPRKRSASKKSPKQPLAERPARSPRPK